MLERSMIMMTDQINKYGYKFTTGALANTLNQTWKEGTPSFINHDYGRPLGWSVTLGLWVMPHQSCLLGLFTTSENDEEQLMISKICSEHILSKLVGLDKEEEDSIRVLSDGNLTSDAVFLKRECSSVIDKNIAKKLFPELYPSNEQDKRSLINLRDLVPIAPGVFEYKGVAIFAHRFFRKSFSQINNFNIFFLSRFQNLLEDESLDLKIALDPHAIGLVATYSKPIELDYWRGPKFQESLNDIPTGVTVHKASESEKFFTGIEETNFWWHLQNGIQSLECEELRVTPTLDSNTLNHEEFYGCKYIHSMVNPEEGFPYHLDGAIRAYSEDSFINRLDVDISKAGKDTDYYKLWRVDGEINITIWKELIYDFYKENNTITEYFAGSENNIETENSEVVTETPNLLLEYVDSEITFENGLQLLVSYYSTEEFDGSYGDCNLLSVNRLVDEESSIDTFDFYSLDFIKILKKKFNLTVYQDIKYIAYEDLSFSLPLFVIHNTENIVSAAKTYIDAISEFIVTLGDEERLMTFAFACKYDNNFIKFSFRCNVGAFVYLTERYSWVFPEEVSDIGDWIEKFQEVNSRNFPSAKYDFSHQRGINKPIREFIIYRDYHVGEIAIQDDELLLRFDESGKDIAQLVHEGKLTIAPVSIIERVTCNSCGNNYLWCDCSQLMDIKVIDEFEPKGYFWTQKSSFNAKNS